MRRKGIVTIGLVALLAASGVYALHTTIVSGSNEVATEFQVNFPRILATTGNPTFELATSLPSVDNAMMTYKVNRPDVSAEKVTDIGRRLEFAGDVIPSSGGLSELAYEMSDEGSRLIVWRNSGTIEYNRSELLFPNQAPNLPSNEEAKRIATAFLADAGLLPSDALIQEPVPGARMAGPKESSTGEMVAEEFIAHLLVRFDRDIGGLPVTGPGAKFGVRIGDGGEVGRVLKVWREMEPYNEVPVKSPEQALQELKDGEGTHNAPQDCEKVVLDKIYVAYWMEPAPDPQEYVVPVYVFEGECLNKDGEYLDDFCGWCNAV